MQFAKYFSWGLIWLSLGSSTYAADNTAKVPELKRIDFLVRVVEPSGKPIAGTAVQV